LRILPAYVAFLLVLAAFQFAEVWRIDATNWFGLLTYTMNFLPVSLSWQGSHVWSLSVEEHFYLVWPLLVFLLPLVRCRRIALCAVVAAYLLRCVVLSCWPDQPVDLWTPTRMDDLAVGCLLAFAAREAWARAWLARFTGSWLPLTILLIAFACCQLVLSRVIGTRVFGAALPPFLALANTVNSLTIALLLWKVVTCPEWFVVPALEFPAMAQLGTISYSLYLWHPLFLLPEVSWWGQLPLMLVLTGSTALASYHLIEKPFLRLKDRLERPAAKPATGFAMIAPAA
jgi:peptidoglycan/LPS O-acetylase OafA/YrhL